MKKLFVGLAALTIAAASSASAVTIVNESAAGTGAFPTGGDYANSFGASTNNLGNLPLGQTDIIGDLRLSQGDTADWFYFTLPADREITSTLLQTSTFSRTALRVFIRDDTGSTVVDTGNFFAGGNANLTSFVSGLVPGLYNFGLTYSFGDQDDIDYTLTTLAVLDEMPPVPLPAGVLLLGAGLGVLALRGRRKAA